MSVADILKDRLPDLYVTEELDCRPSALPDYRREMLALYELAARMAEKPDDLLPRFVDLAIELSDGVSGGISLYEPDPAPGVFRWHFLRGILSSFDGATTPRDFSPCGVTLDQNGPVLCRHPERYYHWISDAGIVLAEVLLVPLYVFGAQPLGTLWIVSEEVGQFTRAHARAMSELGTFVGIALRMREAESRLQAALAEQELLAGEMSHRVKNLFAITDAMIRAGAKTAPDTRTFAETLSGRLHALARAHALVSRNTGEVGSTLRTRDIASVLRAIVEPHQDSAGGTSRIRTNGPIVTFGDQAINAIAMIFHELTTNAAKYGALSTEAGFVEASWDVQGGALQLSWVERGGPAIRAVPVQAGFGSVLLKNTVTGQLGGSLSYHWASEGLRVAIVIPQSRLEV